MNDLGYDSQACLKGSGILLSQLDNANARMSLQQELAFYRNALELAFYRNALELSGDPTIGLKLGEPFVPQRYGRYCQINFFWETIPA
jgi:hypothetical protein